MSLGVPPGKLKKVFGERSEFLCLDSCPTDLGQEKRKKIDGWYLPVEVV